MRETNKHYPFYITAETLTSKCSYAFSNIAFGIHNFMEDSLTFIVLHTELVHLYSDSLKD